MRTLFRHAACWLLMLLIPLQTLAGVIRVAAPAAVPLTQSVHAPDTAHALPAETQSGEHEHSPCLHHTPNPATAPCDHAACDAPSAAGGHCAACCLMLIPASTAVVSAVIRFAVADSTLVHVPTPALGRLERPPSRSA